MPSRQSREMRSKASLPRNWCSGKPRYPPTRMQEPRESLRSMVWMSRRSLTIQGQAFPSCSLDDNTSIIVERPKGNVLNFLLLATLFYCTGAQATKSFLESYLSSELHARARLLINVFQKKNSYRHATDEDGDYGRHQGNTGKISS